MYISVAAEISRYQKKCLPNFCKIYEIKYAGGMLSVLLRSLKNLFF